MTALTWDLEISFTNPGEAESFTSVKADTVGDNLVAGWGNTSSSPTDRVATTGTISFTLNNATSNSGAALGYYSPDNASKRAKFQLGNAVRLKLVDGANTRYKKYYISTIVPVPGAKGTRAVKIGGVDYMGKISGQYASALAPGVNQRTDEGLTSIVALLPNAPDLTSFATGMDTYKYIFGDFTGNKISLFNAAQRLVQSDMGYLFSKCDATVGETLTSETRGTRLRTSSLATISAMSGLDARQEDNKIFNEIIVSYTPVTIGTTTEIVYTHSSEIVIGSGAVYTFTADYTGPEGAASEVHLYPASGITPTLGTDFRLYDGSGGTGNFIGDTTYITIAVTAWNDRSADVTITSSYGFTLYIPFFQLRAKTIKLYAQAEATAQDTAANLAYYGKKTLRITLPYQDSASNAQAFADDLLAKLKTPHTDVISKDFWANSNSTNMTAGVLRDIGDRVTVPETVTGINTVFNIIGLQKTITPGSLMSVRWYLERANTATYWFVGAVGYDEVGVNTIVGV